MENGIYVWPHIRIKLYFLVTNSNSESEDTKYEFGKRKENSSIFF
jgi:hypothetical protein